MSELEALQVGIVGAAGRGGSFQRAFELLQGVRVRAVCDIRAEELAEAAARFGASESYTDYQEMLAHADLDAVVIGTPMPYHVSQAIAALEQGVHVLSEVPAGVSIDECRELVRACQRSRATYMLAENRNYYEQVVLVAELVKLERNGAAVGPDTPLKFRNVYTPPPEPDPLYPTLRVPLKAVKTLKNATLTAGQFTFQLKDARGTVLAEAQNAADGSITFPDRTFRREVSNYIFTINEKPGNDKAIAYDATVYTIKVTTTARDDKLRARVNVERDGVPYGGDIHFTNQRKMPATGDSTLWTVLSLAGVAIILTGGALVLNRRRKAHQP